VNDIEHFVARPLETDSAALVFQCDSSYKIMYAAKFLSGLR
jgi:hypothetical protein